MAEAAAAKPSGARVAPTTCLEYPRNGSQAPVSFAQQFCAETSTGGQFPVLSTGSVTAGEEDPLFVTRLAWRVNSKRGPPFHLCRS